MTPGIRPYARCHEPGNEFFEAKNDPKVTLNDNMYVGHTGLNFKSQNGLRSRLTREQMMYR